MDVSQLVHQKLNELGLEQRDLANAAEVTESYISQLLNRKKMPPAPNRTDLYDKLGRFLKLPAGKLAGKNSGRRDSARRDSDRRGRLSSEGPSTKKGARKKYEYYGELSRDSHSKKSTLPLLD